MFKNFRLSSSWQSMARFVKRFKILHVLVEIEMIRFTIHFHDFDLDLDRSFFESPCKIFLPKIYEVFQI